MLTTFPFQQGLFIDPFFFHFKERKGIEGNCSYAHIIWLSGPNKVATKMNSKSVDKEDFESEGQRRKKSISLHDVWLSIRPPTSVSLLKPRRTKINTLRDQNATAVWEL